MTPSPVFEFRLTESAGSVSATKIRSYNPSNGPGTTVLGDVQRLPNGTLAELFAGRPDAARSPSG